MVIFQDRITGRFSAINFILVTTLVIHAIVLLMPQIGMQIQFWGGLIPSQVFAGQVWRVLSYAFLHSTHGIFHIAFNMLGLWMFGREIEYRWGARKFFAFYLFAAIFAGAFSLLPVIFTGSYANVNIIGASGALMALLVIYAYYFPDRQLLFFFVIPLRVKTAIIIYAIISILGTAGSVGNIAHITHLGGLISGFVWILIGDKLDLIVKNIGLFFSSAPKVKKDGYTFSNDDIKKNSRAEAVDRILDKINHYGIGSLTETERQILQDASADFRKKR